MTLAIGWPHEVGENLRTWPHEGGVWQAPFAYRVGGVMLLLVRVRTGRCGRAGPAGAVGNRGLAGLALPCVPS